MCLECPQEAVLQHFNSHNEGALLQTRDTHVFVLNYVQQSRDIGQVSRFRVFSVDFTLVKIENRKLTVKYRPI